ncbi:MAG: hypothetical protein ACPGF8_07615, partial [Opitutales bacterium]
LGHGLWADYIERKTRYLDMLSQQQRAFESDDADQLRHEQIWEANEPASEETTKTSAKKSTTKKTTRKKANKAEPVIMNEADLDDI